MMDKDKSHHGSRSLLPRFSASSPPNNSYNLPPLGTGSSSGHFGHNMGHRRTPSDNSQFCHDPSRMPDNPPNNMGLRRALSETITPPYDIHFESYLRHVQSHHGSRSLFPPSGRFSLSSPPNNSYNLNPSQSGPSNLPQLGPRSSSEQGHFGHVMPSDNSRFGHSLSQNENMGHRHAHSEAITLPYDIRFDSGLGVTTFNSNSSTSGNQVGGESSFLLAAKPGSSSAYPFALANQIANNTGGALCENPRITHQHSQSMDGLTTTKPEMHMSNAKKAKSAARLDELALTDPKHAMRVLENRLSAAISKERKMGYIAELERKVQTLQREAISLSAQLTSLQRDMNGLTSENSELKQRLKTMEEHIQLQDALNDVLKEEIQHLQVVTGQTIVNQQLTVITCYNMIPGQSGAFNLPLLGTGSSSEQGHFGHDMPSDNSRFGHDPSRMPDNPPNNMGHRRAHIETIRMSDAKRAISAANLALIDPKRAKRSIEVQPSEQASSHRTVTEESRIIVRKRSGVLLDDGYKWRKYGEKILNSYPRSRRSYYKCASPGCNVRRRIEWSPTDLKDFIATYEGKHTHDAPLTNQPLYSQQDQLQQQEQKQFENVNLRPPSMQKEEHGPNASSND